MNKICFRYIWSFRSVDCRDWCIPYITPCRLVEEYRRFEVLCCLHYWDRRWRLQILSVYSYDSTQHYVRKTFLLMKFLWGVFFRNFYQTVKNFVCGFWWRKNWLFFYFVLWPTNTQLFHKWSHSYMSRHYRVILRELLINTLPSYTSISNAAVGNTIYN